MTDTLDLIEETRGNLREAYKQAANAQAKQKIKDSLNELADFQEQVILQQFMDKAAEIQGLSDALNKIIQDLQGKISNFLLGNLSRIAERTDG